MLQPSTSPAVLLAIVLASPFATAQVELTTIRGQATGDRFGCSLAAIQDHRPPSVTSAAGLAVGASGATAPLAPANTGTVSIFGYLSPQPTPGNPGLVLTGTGIAVLRSLSAGAATGDQFGFSLAGGFDRNGDGVTDLMVGIPGAGANQGMMRIESGLITFPVPFPPATSTAGLGTSDRGGEAVAFVGDIDGSGTLDFMFGAPNGARTQCGCSNTNVAGRIVAVDGQTPAMTNLANSVFQATGLLQSFCCQPNCPSCQNDRIGTAFSALGDIDSPPDGVPEFVWSNSHMGIVSVVGKSGSAFVVKATLTSPTPTPGFGKSVAVIGDILPLSMPDGIPDLGVGAPDAGKVFLYSGAALLTSTTPAAVLDFSTHSSTAPSGGSFGQSIAAAGDCDGDGIGDILVGAPDSNATGMAFLFSGRTLAVIGFVAGDQPGDKMGWSVATVPDLTGDGNPEFAAGAPSAQGQTGVVRIMTMDTRGRVGAVLSDQGCSPTANAMPVWSLPNGICHVGDTNFAWGVANGTTASLAVVVVGLAPLQPPVPLPTLTPGCTLYTTGVATLSMGQFGGQPAAQNGMARIAQPVPNLAGLRGMTFLAQWYLVGSNLLDGSMTNLLHLTIQ